LLDLKKMAYNYSAESTSEYLKNKVSGQQKLVTLCHNILNSSGVAKNCLALPYH